MDIVVKILKFYKERFVNLVVTVNIIRIAEFVKVKQYSNYLQACYTGCQTCSNNLINTCSVCISGY